MGAPVAGQQWPPKPHDRVYSLCQERQVWWEGDPEQLAQFYGGTGAGYEGIPAMGGRWRRAWDAFWGKTSRSSDPKRLHVPVAADLGRVSAATLFSNPPTFSAADTTDKGLQGRVDAILNTSDMQSRLLIAGESASMLSGVYGRIVWDTTARDHAWIDFVDADRAIPTFRWGQLTEITFWTDLPSDDDRVVLRHLEHHRAGSIDHYLFEGTTTSLGTEIDLAQHPGTAGLDPSIKTGVPRLAAAHFPNHRPAPEFRGTPELSPLGRADLTADMIHLLDAIDRTWSSWMNDLEIGRGRIIVSEDLLKRNGPGTGTGFDFDRAVFSPVGSAMRNGEETTVLEAHQFAIRVDDHLRTFEALLRRAISRAGYSPLTFGLTDEAAMTATEIAAKERDTNATRQTKIRLWSAGLDYLAETLLAIDDHIFHTGTVGELEVEFAPMHQTSEDAKAKTVQLWEAAQAASRETKVRYLHPEWDDEKVRSEALAIGSESEAPTSIIGPEEHDYDEGADAPPDRVDDE